MPYIIIAWWHLRSLYLSEGFRKGTLVIHLKDVPLILLQATKGVGVSLAADVMGFILASCYNIHYVLVILYNKGAYGHP